MRMVNRRKTMLCLTTEIVNYGGDGEQEDNDGLPGIPLCWLRGCRWLSLASAHLQHNAQSLLAMQCNIGKKRCPASHVKNLLKTYHGAEWHVWGRQWAPRRWKCKTPRTGSCSCSLHSLRTRIAGTVQHAGGIRVVNHNFQNENSIWGNMYSVNIGLLAATFWDFHSAHATEPQYWLQIPPSWSMQLKVTNVTHTSYATNKQTQHSIKCNNYSNNARKGDNIYMQHVRAYPATQIPRCLCLIMIILIYSGYFADCSSSSPKSIGVSDRYFCHFCCLYVT